MITILWIVGMCCVVIYVGQLLALRVMRADADDEFLEKVVTLYKSCMAVLMPGLAGFTALMMTGSYFWASMLLVVNALLIFFSGVGFLMVMVYTKKRG